MPVEVSHKLDLDLDLPDNYKDVALKQGEDPLKVPGHLAEFKKIIFGKLHFLICPHSNGSIICLFLQRRDYASPIAPMTNI